MQSTIPPPRRPPHSNRWKVSGENPALFPRRPKIGGMPWAVFGASWHFLSKASCLDRAPDKKAKPPIKRQILGSPDVLAVLLHWQLFLLFAPNNWVPAEISTFHEISVQLLLNIMRQRGALFQILFAPKSTHSVEKWHRAFAGAGYFPKLASELPDPPQYVNHRSKMPGVEKNE